MLAPAGFSPPRKDVKGRSTGARGDLLCLHARRWLRGTGDACSSEHRQYSQGLLRRAVFPSGPVAVVRRSAAPVESAPAALLQ
jgi:hypothetical protein